MVWAHDEKLWRDRLARCSLRDTGAVDMGLRGQKRLLGLAWPFKARLFGKTRPLLAEQGGVQPFLSTGVGLSDRFWRRSG